MDWLLPRSEDEAQEVTELFQGDLFHGVVRIHSVHDDQIESGNHRNEMSPGTPG